MNNSTISIDQIICSWLGKQGYPVHFYAHLAMFAHEAIQELQFTSMPLLHHKLLTRDAAARTFALPNGLSRLARIGVRHGDRWWPLNTDDSLMPFPNTEGHGDMLASEFADDLNVSGNNISWYASSTPGGGFNPNSFSTGLNTSAGGTTTTAPDYWSAYGWCAGYAPYPGVSVDERAGLVMIPETFPFTEIYVAYVGISDIDNLTNIPLYAQAAIEAYITWKYDGGKSAKDDFDEQHRLLRARISPMTVGEIEQIFSRPLSYHYHRQQ